MADPAQNRAMPPISRTATLRIIPAKNGGYVVLVGGHPGTRESIYAAFSNGADLIIGLSEIYTPLPPAPEVGNG